MEDVEEVGDAEGEAEDYCQYSGPTLEGVSWYPGRDGSLRDVADFELRFSSWIVAA